MDIAFDAMTPRGHPVPYSGIYRCEGCGHMISSAKGQVPPLQGHAEHTPEQGEVRWRLVVGHN